MPLNFVHIDFLAHRNHTFFYIDTSSMLGNSLLSELWLLPVPRVAMMPFRSVFINFSFSFFIMRPKLGMTFAFEIPNTSVFLNQMTTLSKMCVVT